MKDTRPTPVVDARNARRERGNLAALYAALVCVPLIAAACNFDKGTAPTFTFAPVWVSTPTTAGYDWVGGTPAVEGGRVFVQEAYNLVGLDAATGRRLWSRRIRIAPAPGPTTLVAGGGRVFVSETDSIMAVDAATGTTIWLELTRFRGRLTHPSLGVEVANEVNEEGRTA